MFDKLAGVEERFLELERQLASGAMDAKELTRISKERASLEPIVAAFREYRALQERRDEAKALLSESDEEMRTLAREELEQVETELPDLEQRLMVLSLPRDPNDDKNVLLEVRAGTGGEEAALFAADLVRMYTRYADRMGWRTEMLSATESATGGFKEIVLLIEGHQVFSRLKFESGVHRVQRVPTTESQGRIHTSACTVAILPEADEVEVVDINPAELRFDTYRSSGAGGQHVNTTDSAVRITHLPTGLVVECQDERSQHKNRDKAMKILRARLYDKMQQEQADQISADRKLQVGSGDRSERIRTYNFPQGRLTDHRINLTIYKLDGVMDGEIAEVVDALVAHAQAERLRESPAGA